VLDKLLTVALTPAAVALDAALIVWGWIAGPTPAWEVTTPGAPLYGDVDEIGL
jgi:hypothetical protein